MKEYLREYLDAINDASKYADHQYIDPRMSDELKFRLLSFGAALELLKSGSVKEIIPELETELKAICDELDRIDPMQSKETILSKMAAFLSSANKAVQFAEYPNSDEYEMKLLEAVHKLLSDTDEKEALKKLLENVIISHDLSFYSPGGA